MYYVVHNREDTVMKAIQIEAFGNPAEVMKLVDVPDVGAPGEGEVVIALEASPIISVSDKAMLATLFDVDLAEVCITSNYEVREGEAPADAFRLDSVPGVGVVVERAAGIKCARSWKILPTVGDDAEYPDVSPRDAKALREWKALGVTV